MALRDPASHVFMPGVGYLRLPKISGYGPLPQHQCNPPKDVVEGDWYKLKPSGGAEPITFQWISNCWVRVQKDTKRLGYPPEYLSSHGWSFIGRAMNRHG